MKSFLLVAMVMFCMIISGCKEEKVEVAVQIAEKPKAEKSQQTDISKILGGWKSSRNTRYGSKQPDTILITTDTVCLNGGKTFNTYYQIQTDNSIMVYKTGEGEWFSVTLLPSGNLQTFGFSDDDEYTKISVEEVNHINSNHENYLEEFYRTGGKNSPNYEPITDFVPGK